VTHFPSTPYATDKCPRRHLIENTDALELYAIRRRTGGVLGLDADTKLTTMALDALDVIDDAITWRDREMLERQARDAAAAEELRRGGA
jgi:hypothetical protein